MKAKPVVLQAPRLLVTLVGAGLARPALGVLFSATSVIFLCVLFVKFVFLVNPARTIPLSFLLPTSFFLFPAFKPADSKTHPQAMSSRSQPAAPAHAPAPQSISYSPPDSPPKSASPPATPATPAGEKSC